MKENLTKISSNVIKNIFLKSFLWMEINLLSDKIQF